MRSRLITVVAYEALWFIVVIGAGRGAPWWVTGIAAAFVLWQVSTSTDRRLALRLVAIALILGVLVDGVANGLQLIGYAAASPALPPGGAPFWILGLWAAFAVTLPGPLRWLAGRPGWAALLGAVGGPLSYAGAERGWSTVHFIAPSWHAWVYLAVTWGAAMAVLAMAASPLRSVPATTVERNGEG